MRNLALAERLVELKGRYPAVGVDLVQDVVSSVLTSMQGDLSVLETGLLAEIEDLGRTIASAKAEIAALRVDDITNSHIPSATDELDAIVSHTAIATDSILSVCETLDGVADALQRDSNPLCQSGAQSLNEATTRIYEACSFQDITGQRISKVVATLKAIETKISTIMASFDGRIASPPTTATDEAALLNGPQLPAVAMDQTDIDRLLASFDGP